MIQHINFDDIQSIADSPYVGSKFETYKNLGAKQKGAVAEKHIVTPILQALGYDVQLPLSSDHDRIVNGRKTEIKASTMNGGKDKYSFLQIRPAQDVDDYMFVTILPNAVRIFVASKDTLKPATWTNRNGLKHGMKFDKCTKIMAPQHGGQDGDSGTFMFYPSMADLETLTEIK